MNMNIAQNVSSAGHPDLFGISGLVRSIKNWFELQRVQQAIRKERDQLAALPDHLLQDIGVSRAEAAIESQRSLEDIPAGRMNCW